MKSNILKQRRGFTLIEMIISITIFSMIIIVISGIFMFLNRMWDRTSGQSTTQIALSEASYRISNDIRNAVDCQIATRFTTNDTLIISSPVADASGGYRMAVSSTNKLTYSTTSKKVYYLSDYTGSYSVNGNILWSGSASGSPLTVTPTASASLIPGTTIGQVTPISSIRFDGPGSSDPSYWFKLTINSPRTYRSSVITDTLTVNVYARNHN